MRSTSSPGGVRRTCPAVMVATLPIVKYLDIEIVREAEVPDEHAMGPAAVRRVRRPSVAAVRRPSGTGGRLRPGPGRGPRLRQRTTDPQPGPAVARGAG